MAWKWVSPSAPLPSPLPSIALAALQHQPSPREAAALLSSRPRVVRRKGANSCEKAAAGAAGFVKGEWHGRCTLTGEPKGWKGAPSRRQSGSDTNALIPAAGCFRDLDGVFSREPCGGSSFAKTGRQLRPFEVCAPSAEKRHARSVTRFARGKPQCHSSWMFFSVVTHSIVHLYS